MSISNLRVKSKNIIVNGRRLLSQLPALCGTLDGNLAKCRINNSIRKSMKKRWQIEQASAVNVQFSKLEQMTLNSRIPRLSKYRRREQWNLKKISMSISIRSVLTSKKEFS